MDTPKSVLLKKAKMKDKFDKYNIEPQKTEKRSVDYNDSFDDCDDFDASIEIGYSVDSSFYGNYGD